MPGAWIAIFYAVAMAVSGAGSLVFGRLFDRSALHPDRLTLVSALFAPLVFLGGFWAALLGAAIWGLGWVSTNRSSPRPWRRWWRAERRASAFGMFTAGYGVFWFLGSAAIGFLYDVSLPAVIAFCVVTAIAAVPIFIAVERMQSQSGTP